MTSNCIQNWLLATAEAQQDVFLQHLPTHSILDRNRMRDCDPGVLVPEVDDG